MFVVLRFFIACKYSFLLTIGEECIFLFFRHNAELFSKLAFGMGKYQDFDMSALDITTVRDFATFMALSSNSQGKNGELVLESFKQKMGNSSWTEFCQKI